MNSCLEEIVFSNNRVEKWLHINATILIPIELQKGRSTEEMPEFQRKLWRNCQEGVIVESFLSVVRRREVFPKKLMKLFKIYLKFLIPSLSNTSEVLCLRKRLRASWRTFALIGFSACCDFWKNLGTLLKLGSESSSFLLASSI